MRDSLAAVCAIAALVATGLLHGSPRLAASRRPQPPSASRTQFDILFDKYLHGDADAAVEDFARWPPARLSADVPPIGKGDDPLAMARLALLFTEAGIRNRRFLRNPVPLTPTRTAVGEWRQLPWPSGNRQGQETFFLGRQDDVRRHLPSLDGFDTYSREASWLIRRTLELARARHDARLVGFCQSWHILAVGQSLSSANWASQGPCIRAALVDFGEDPEILLAVASAMDAGISRQVKRRDGAQSTVGLFAFQPVDASKKTRHRQFTEVQLRAVPVLRRALALDPSLVEARLRLGRLLYELEGGQEARAELERAMRDARQARHVFASYLAGLFLGELHEDEGRLVDAISAYREATAALPFGLSARMALTHALLVAGQSDEGWSIAREAFDDSDVNPMLDTDPWHLYARGQAWQAGSRLHAMREAVRQ